MTLEVLEPVKAILAKVEAATGKGFDLVEKPDLVQLAGVKMARRGMPRHIMRYRLTDMQVLNHSIAHECGHVLRMSSVSEEQRRVPITNRYTTAEAMIHVMPEAERIAAGLPGDAGPQLFNMLYEGLVRQLTNLPSDIAIERWLCLDYPALRDAQLASLRLQVREAEAGLDRKVRVMSPRLIYESCNTMNYAFLLLVGEALGESLLGLYAGSPFRDGGLRLAELTRSRPLDTYLDEIAMVDAWAEHLGLSRWFEWTGFENVPQGYEAS